VHFPGLDAPEGGVQAAAGDELVVAAGLDDPPLLEHVDAVGVAHGREAVGDDDDGPVPPTSSRERWIAASVSLSTAEVASSSTSTGGSLRIARAIDNRWRCPPDSFWPRSPTIVS
jgi:hypothetical protein